MKHYSPLLNVYVVWHPDADSRCRPLAAALYKCLNRDPDKPFSRGIGIPTYFRCVAGPDREVPLAIDLDGAEHTVILVLVEEHLVFVEPWADYVADLFIQAETSAGKHLVVPVALSGSAFNLHSAIAKANFVRLFNLEPDTVKIKLLHYVTHALARLLENKQRSSGQGIKLSPLPIKLFISHTKREAKALELAKALKDALDDTQLDRFFDSVDIASGHDFVEEIAGNLKEAALIAIRSDRYNDSPWCRMEVMAAKRLNRPMIVVDILDDREDRSFPYLSNVPVIRFTADKPISDPETAKKLQAVIDFALLEVLRFVYIQKHFEHLQKCQWLPQQALILSRAPEELDLRKTKAEQIIYPDPPLGYEENLELGHYKIPMHTPTTIRGSWLSGLAIGVSISDTDPGELQILGLSAAHLQNAMQQIACQCLVQGATLVYGGDLRKGGFTENLLELVRYHNDDLKRAIKPVKNYLVWPLKSSLDIEWAAENKDALSIEVSAKPEALAEVKSPPPGENSDAYNYFFARCLTAMREHIVATTQARIMMGGKTAGYKGKYPGLVEEALLTLKAGKPLFLLGGYGGASRVIIEALQGRQPDALTLDYQCRQSSYKSLVDYYNRQVAEQQLAIEPISYHVVSDTFAEIGINGLNNGLSNEENLRLFVTQNHEEAIGLILEGLMQLSQAGTVKGGSH